MGTIKKAKDKLKAKVAKAKAKVAEKCKVAKKAKVAAAVLAIAVLCAGCLDTAPASRATSAAYRDIVVRIGDHSKSCKVTVTLGDGAIASADSAGSTETQTATPTLDVKTDLDLRYNDAIAGATAASRSTLGAIGDGLDAVLGLMQSKGSGTVSVTKKDGTAATVKCDNGQCGFCEDGACSE